MMNLAIGLAGFVAAVLVLSGAAYRAMAKERASRRVRGQEIDLHIRSKSPQLESVCATPDLEENPFSSPRTTSVTAFYLVVP